MDQRDLSNEYLREDAQQTRDENLYYVQEAKRDPSRANVFQSKLDNRDHSAQPCFDAMGDKGCLMSKKSPPCPYNHDHKVFTAYQDAKPQGRLPLWLATASVASPTAAFDFPRVEPVPVTRQKPRPDWTANLAASAREG